MMPLYIANLTDVTINIDGTLLASQNWRQWPIYVPNGGKSRYIDFLTFDTSNGLTFNSPSKSGVLDGQGYMWWMREWLKLNKAHRPKLLVILTSSNIELSQILVTNSPSFHIVPKHCENVYMHDFEIYVDSWG